MTDTLHTDERWYIVKARDIRDGSFLSKEPQAEYDKRRFGSNAVSMSDKAILRFLAAAPETAAERDKLKELNAELLEALEVLLSASRGMPVSHDNLCQATLDGACSEAEDVIAKAKATGAS